MKRDGEACYRPVSDGVYDPTVHAQGAWSPHEQHMAPMAGLIAHEVERFAPRDGMQIVKLGYEILGFMPLERTTVQVSLQRPGKTIEQLAFTATVADREVVRGTAWRLLGNDTSVVAGSHERALPRPDELPELNFRGTWGGGYIESLQIRAERGVPGRNQAWLNTEQALVQGVESGPVAEYVRLVDTANGVATRVDPGEWMFPNVDLVIHLWRRPDPAWVGLDTMVSYGPAGVGLTSSTLHDVHGPLGRAEQVLTVRPMPQRP
ncbi:MAG: thioesterase family protein [Actinomycetales bacterium]